MSAAGKLSTSRAMAILKDAKIAGDFITYLFTKAASGDFR
jgi:hypothetical protein